VSKLGDSGVVITVRVWVPRTLVYLVMKDLLWKIKKSLDEAGISILFPQLDVWIKPRHARERGGKRLNFIAAARKVVSSAGWGS